MSERIEGWYWVKVAQCPDWECARWQLGEWELVGRYSASMSDHVYAVGPRIPTPDEPWQCVPIESTWQMEGVADIDPYDYQQILSVAPKP